MSNEQEISGGGVDPLDPAVPAEPSEMSAEQLAEARLYGRLHLLCDLIEKALDVALLVVMTLIVAWPLDQLLSEVIHSRELRLMALFLVISGASLAISFPLSAYSGYVLEHRFGLSRQTFGRWLRQYAKRQALSLVFGMALFIGLYEIIWHTGSWWWLVAAGGFFVVSVVVGQLLPVLIVPLFYKIDRVDDAELLTRMARLVAGTGLTISGVYRLGLSADTSKANAMLAGLGATRRVLLGDTLLNQFTHDEIEVILAHEIGHHVYRHIHKLILAGLVYSAAGFWICDRMLLAWTRIHFASADYANLPTATLPLVMLVLTIFGLVLEPLQNIVSRHYERQCDRYALDRTGLDAAYVSCFRKLAAINKSDPHPNPLEVFLFHSHPPISERLAAGQAFGTDSAKVSGLKA